jgi:hypothetical protein
MALNVCLVASLGGGKNDHHAIFVETKADTGNGVLFHVTGDIQNGMTYQSRDEKPEGTVIFLTKSLIGKVSAVDFPRIDTICRAIPPPQKQFNGPKRIEAVSGMGPRSHPSFVGRRSPQRNIHLNDKDMARVSIVIHYPWEPFSDYLAFQGRSFCQKIEVI